MSSKKMIDKLNKQIELEAYASNLYLSMHCWLDNEGFVGAAEFMRAQTDEERMHMLKIFDFLSEIGAHAVTPLIKQPPLQFDSVKALMEQVYEHEKAVSQSIFDLMALAKEEKDFTAESFLNWYIEEQKEEEDTMRTILDRINLIGDGPQSNYFIDLEIQKISAAQAEADAEA